ATPFPSEDTTPPVTKIYFGAIRAARAFTPGLSALHRSDVRIIMDATFLSVKSNSSRRNIAIFYGRHRETFFPGTGLQQAGNTLWRNMVSAMLQARKPWRR